MTACGRCRDNASFSLLKNALRDVAVQESEESINGTAEALRCCPIMPLFFHIAPYLHRKQPGNYLTRGVKKPLQIVAAV